MVRAQRKFLDQVRAIVLSHLAGREADVYLFGSQAAGTARPASDIDVAVDPREPLSARLWSDIEEALEESTVPHRVELVDLSRAEPAFRDRVRREGLRWTA